MNGERWKWAKMIRWNVVKNKMRSNTSNVRRAPECWFNIIAACRHTSRANAHNWNSCNDLWSIAMIKWRTNEPSNAKMQNVHLIVSSFLSSSSSSSKNNLNDIISRCWECINCLILCVCRIIKYEMLWTHPFFFFCNTLTTCGGIRSLICVSSSSKCRDSSRKHRRFCGYSISIFCEQITAPLLHSADTTLW